MGISNDFANTPSLFHKKVYRLLVILGFTIFLGGAFAVPFCYETQTLWYKVGTDKVLLRAGQLAGLLALALLVLQIVLSSRTTFLDNLFGRANMMRWHRTNGPFIAGAALSHIIMVLAPEGFDNLPIGKKYWPEMVGAALFLLISFMVFSSHFRSALQLNYNRWRTLHRPIGYLVAILVLIHVLFVSESFEQGSPRVVLLSVFAGLALLVAASKTIPSNSK